MIGAQLLELTRLIAESESFRPNAGITSAMGGSVTMLLGVQFRAATSEEEEEGDAAPDGWALTVTWLLDMPEGSCEAANTIHLTAELGSTYREALDKLILMLGADVRPEAQG